MNRKTGLVIIIVFVLIGLAVLAWVLYPSLGKFPFLGGGGTTGGGRDFFPFGDGGGDTHGDNGGSGATTTTPAPPISNGPLPILREISLVAVGGAHAYVDEENEITYVRFLERSTGHIFETTTATDNNSRITNTTIPKVQNVAWNMKGTGVILQYEGDSYEGAENNSVVSFYGEVASNASSTGVVTPQGERTLEGIFLGGNITAIASSPDYEQIFTLEKDAAGTIGYASNINGSNKKKLFESPLIEWQVLWPQEKVITLTSNASAKARGFSYTLDAVTGKITPLLSNMKGLTTLMSHDGSKVLYSEERDGEGTTLGIYTKKDGSLMEISLKTFPEKCVWGIANVNLIYCGVPKTDFYGTQPDEWYQGVHAFNDAIWTIDATTGVVDMVVDLGSIAGKEIDVSMPFLDQHDTFLFFVNKNDLHLWSLKISI